MPIHFRPLAPADADEAARLIRSAFAVQDLATDPPSSALTETGEIVLRKLEHGGGFGVSEDGALIALVLFEPRKDALYIGRLAVLPSARGRGLARRLMWLAEDEARERKYARSRLHVRLALPANQNFFERCGYREAERRAHPGYAAPTFAVMEKVL